MDDEAKHHSWLLSSLGFAQIISWGTMFYAYGVLMQPMQTELHISKSTIVGAYSIALLLSGLLSTLAGSIIDRFGGRLLMGTGTVLAAIMLALLSRVQSVLDLYLVWAGIGVAMSATLYQPVFAVVTQLFGSGYRRAITFLTLFGGFASTVFWPLTQALLIRYGWRETWLLYAAANLIICLPVHILLPNVKKQLPNTSTLHQPSSINLATVLQQPSFYFATAAFAFNALVFSAMSLHLISILQTRGLSAVQAASIGAMIGPMQVLGRILEVIFGNKASPRHLGLIALWILPLALILLFVPSEWKGLYIFFAFLYGMSNGVMTIVRGALPVELYGYELYGAISGAMAMPVMLATAAGPFVASLLYGFTGGYAGTLIALITFAAIGAALFLYVSLPSLHSSQES